MFNHLGFGLGKPLPVLEQITSETGSRVYATPTGQRYPSVTTVLAEKGKQGIMEWRNRVGVDQANAIARKAAGRGTNIHTAVERYLNNESPWVPGKTINPLHYELFHVIEPLLKMIDNIHCQETRMFSHHLRMAGTVDCIAEFNGKLSVIDFKTSNKPKKPEWITSYFMQCAAYAIMYEELTGIPIQQLVVLVAVEETGDNQLFIEKRDIWAPELLQWRDNYEKVYASLTEPLT
jgi:genome maintenance exonuclease 1